MGSDRHKCRGKDSSKYKCSLIKGMTRVTGKESGWPGTLQVGVYATGWCAWVRADWLLLRAHSVQHITLGAGRDERR